MPSRNIHIYRTKVLSRNFCVGSATFGGVYDLVMEDCTIGDDLGSSPWAIKYKSHQGYAGTLRNHTYRRLRVGKIAPNSYQQKGGGCESARPCVCAVYMRRHCDLVARHLPESFRTIPNGLPSASDQYSRLVKCTPSC